MSTRTNTGIKSKGRSRHAPSLAGMDMGDASLIAINEMCQKGIIDYYAFNAGKIWERQEVEHLLREVSKRAREILENRHTQHFLNTPHGKQIKESWYNVPLREVIYALSTAHPNCLRVFRVFHGKTMEWIGDNSHRKDSKESGSIDLSQGNQPRTTCNITGYMGSSVNVIAPPNISNGKRSQGQVICNIP